ncbi:MAG: TIGR01777 family oxidoreductase [Gammaproteobacteria bacterium]|nr:TIGR01777 family oxidoreductase [Gammaproteobacteria bacterium]MBU1624428.1 TIGR01777 family oxidoreductase [Gammaproteobacteria bacterium]MBU1981156.1 TIGR01777 family oxidoreductase [Gammaproteobacteria bacterium]
MNILFTGGTGLIGRALCPVLLAEGHTLTVFSRHPETVASKCGAGVQALASLDDWQPDMCFDAVINLAGEPIVDAAWTERRKQALRNSRIALTQHLVERIAQVEQKPAVLLSGSAIGYYGGRGDQVLAETFEPGADFPAQLCIDWEAAAIEAEKHGVRVCLLRTGLILSRDGGLLARMLTPFRLGLGARLGDGKQWMSWIHIDDYVQHLLHLLHDEKLNGPFNMTSPQPVTNAEFTRILAKVLRRPAPFSAPVAMLKLAMGERAALVLEGQRVLPARLEASGVPCAYPELESALRAILG